MSKLKGILIGCLMSSFCGLACAAIYKWTDSQGTVHYSDFPGPGAKAIDLPGIQNGTSGGSSPPSSNAASGSQDNKPVGNSSYEKVAIAQPENKATIRNPQGYLLVSVEISPALQNGDSLQLIIDGNPFGKPQTSPGFAINNLERGSHKLAVQVVNVNGDVVMTSDPIEVYMMQPRVNMTPANTKPNASGGGGG